MGERHEAHVVEVERMRRGAVGERGVRGAGSRRRPKYNALPAAARSERFANDPRRGLVGARQGDADGVEHGRSRSRARVRGRRPGRDETTEARDRCLHHTPPPVVAASGFPIAAMNLCLIYTQSSGGLTAGADSFVLATMTHGPGSVSARLTAFVRSRSSRTVAVAGAPSARATASRSAPCAVAVSCP